MAQVDLLVNDVKRRFFVSFASTDSMIPSYMVPVGSLRREPTVQLQARGFVNELHGERRNRLKMIGRYHAAVESVPGRGDCFGCEFAFNVAHLDYPETKDMRYGVLGADFLGTFAAVVVRRRELEFRAPNGRPIRVPLVAEQRLPGDPAGPDDALPLPTLRRVSAELVQPDPDFFWDQFAERVDDENSGDDTGKDEDEDEDKGEDEVERRDEAKQSVKQKVRASRVVVFGLETTGFGRNAEVLQVAAKHGDKVLNVHVLPDGDVPPHITRLTGLAKRDGQLFLGDAKKDAVSAEQAVERLLAFLRDLADGDGGGGAVLVAHTAFRFDADHPRDHLVRLVEAAGRRRDFESLVGGFADTLPFFQDAMPERAAQDKKYTLEALAADFLRDGGGGHGDNGDLHDAEADVRALERLMKLADMTPMKMIACARPLSDFLSR